VVYLGCEGFDIIYYMKYLLMVPSTIWLLLSTAFFAWGEYLSKKWGMNPGWFFAIFIALVYGIGSMFWLPYLLYKNELAIRGTIWSVVSLVVTVMLGVLIFHEKISLVQIVGLLLAFVAVALLSI